MKRIHRVAALSALAFLASTAAAWAQSTGTIPVVVVDIGEIFKNHPAFNQKMEALREEVKQHDEFLQQEGQKLLQKQQAIQQTLSPGSDQYKQEEEKLARLQAQLTTDAQLKRKDFMEREAELYFTTYNEVQSVIRQFAEKYSISLVLRFSRAEMKPEDRNSIMQGVNRPVVFYDSKLDITDQIIAYFTRQSQQQARSSTPASAQQAPRTGQRPANQPTR